MVRVVLDNISAVIQTGHNCKIVAFSSVDNYFSDQNAWPRVPLHKGDDGLFSIRQLAKLSGSQQGELLAIAQLATMAAPLGYASEIFSFEHNFPQFWGKIVASINIGLPLICFFLISAERFITLKGAQQREHACVICGYDDDRKILHVLYDNTSHWVDGFGLFQSSCSLTSTRSPEAYRNIKRRDKVFKYDLTRQQLADRIARPPSGKNTGFKAKFFILSPHDQTREKRLALLLQQSQETSLAKEIQAGFSRQ